MHDLRFRQMEGGLPEQFRQEQELERQRDVHDDLITRGLSIITDCYLDQAERACRSESVDFARCSLEGKNYRELVKEANSGKHDPVAFAAWDGSNSESGSRHTLTTWYWLLLKPAAGNTPLLAAVAAFVLILLAEIGWARSASRKAGTARG